MSTNSQGVSLRVSPRKETCSRPAKSHLHHILPSVETWHLVLKDANAHRRGRRRDVAMARHASEEGVDYFVGDRARLPSEERRRLCRGAIMSGAGAFRRSVFAISIIHITCVPTWVNLVDSKKVFSGETSAPSATRPGPPHTPRSRAPPSSPETRPTRLRFADPPPLASPAVRHTSHAPHTSVVSPAQVSAPAAHATAFNPGRNSAES